MSIGMTKISETVVLVLALILAACAARSLTLGGSHEDTLRCAGRAREEAVGT